MKSKKHKFPFFPLTKFKLLPVFIIIFSIFLVSSRGVKAQIPSRTSMSMSAEEIVCADFSQLAAGESVEGLGTIQPQLNITTSGGNTEVIDEGVAPGAYNSPNGESGIPNNGVGDLAGFADRNRLHDYVFTFAPDVTVDYFSAKMLDFGDFNAPNATEHEVSLVAYDADGNEITNDVLFFTSDGKTTPRDGSAGDLWITGDATTAAPGQPGNYTFTVAGNGIARLEMHYAHNGDGSQDTPSDPYFGMAVLCFQAEQSQPELDPPTAALTQLRPKRPPFIGGKFLVEYACSETAPNLVSATINGYDVVNGQDVNLVVGENESPRIVDDMLIWLFAPDFHFDVVCADDSGNQVSTTVVPEFDVP